MSISKRNLLATAIIAACTNTTAFAACQISRVQTLAEQPETCGPPRYAGHLIQPGTPTAVPQTIPPPGISVVGLTDAQIYAAFTATVLANLRANPNADAQFTAAGPYEMAWLSTEFYRNGTENDVANLAMLMAQKLKAPNLAVARSAFGTGMDNYVRAYSTASVQTAYFATPSVQQDAVQPQSAYQYELLGLGSWIPVEWRMAPNDVWWEEIVKNGATVASADAAVILRFTNAGVRAFLIGYSIGTYIYIKLDYLDPNINIEIGNVEGAAVDAIINAVTVSSAESYVDIPGFYDLVDGTDYTYIGDWYWWGE